MPPVPARYIRTDSDRRAVEQGYRWSWRAIRHVVRFAKTLRDPGNPNRPFHLLGWQLRDVVIPLFGWRRPDGRRRFRRCDVWIPKKNGKTAFESFLGLYGLLADGQERPRCAAVANSADQVSDVFEDADAMLEGTAWRLAARTIAFKHLIQTAPPHKGAFRCLTSSADSAEGLRGSLVMIDEVHVALQRNRRLWRALRYAGTGRAEPLLLLSSTAGDDPQGLPHDLWERAVAIRDGTRIDLETLVVIYAAAADQDEYSDAELAAANPAVGEVLELSQLKADYAAACRDGELDDFKRYRLNLWTKRSKAWLDVNAWQRCARPLGTGTRSQMARLAGLTAWAGVDLSSRGDLTAAVLVALDGNEKRLVCVPHFWLPRAGLAKRSQLEMDYEAAAAGGWLTICEGELIDYAAVRGWLLEAHASVPIAGVAFDPWRAASLAADLEPEFPGQVFSVKQGWQLSEPMHRIAECVSTGNAEHDGNPVMAWCVANTEVRMDNNGKVRPVKPPKRTCRIDGLVAMVVGLYLAMFPPETAGEFHCA